LISGIERCIEAGIKPIKINYCLIIRGFNDDEILDFARMANEKGLHVRFIEFMPFGEQGLWDSSKVVSSSEIEGIIKTSYTLEPSSNYGGGPAQMFKINGGNGQVCFISPVSTHLCSRCNRVRLTADGMLRPCLFSTTEYDVKAFAGNCSDDEVKAL
jgi:cyclic pyranopterin phosphate synthase